MNANGVRYRSSFQIFKTSTIITKVSRLYLSHKDLCFYYCCKVRRHSMRSMKCRKVPSLLDFSDTSNRNGSSPDDTNEAETEVATYRAEQVVRDMNNSLKSWSLKSHKLSSIASKLLRIPATSVPSEQLFSLAGNILNKKRALDPDNVDMLCFLYKNL